MKKKLLLIPMLAGLMLAASCSKDDDASVADGVVSLSSDAEPAVEQPVVQKTYPLTIQAKKETSVSKIGLGTDGLSQLFESTDKLLLTDETSGTVYATLDLQNGEGTTSATFSKDLTEDEKTSMSGKTIRAIIKGTAYTVGIQSSTTSLADAVQKYCYLKATETFTYSDGSEISSLTLADQQAYIAFTVADGQRKVSIKKDADTEYTWVDVNTTDHQVWVVVPGGQTYSTRLKKKTLSATAGNVYTLTETDVVDLGLSVLWCVNNATDEKITYSSATSLYGTADDKGNRLPTKAEYDVLVAVSSSWDATNKGRVFSNDYGSVFFYAAGYGDKGVGTTGNYWSNEPNNKGGGWYLDFDSSKAILNSGSGSSSSYSVRLVRALSL